MGEFCHACYGRLVYCRRCRTRHCQCSWNVCPQTPRKRAVLFFLLLLLAAPASLAGQRFAFDPDHCLTCRDSEEHLALGAATVLVMSGPWIAEGWRKHAWQRVAMTTVLATAYELMGAFPAPDRRGTNGYGFGTKDLAFGVGGAIAFEGLRAVVRQL